MPSHRQIAFIRSVAVTVGGALVIWFGAAAITMPIFGHDRQAAAPYLALAKLASLAWVGAVGWLVVWRRLDERQRETRKFAWFIGSTAAILLTAPIMLFSFWNGDAFLEQFVGRRATPGTFLAIGWVGLVFAQLLGSLVARAGWWATKH